MGKYMWLSDWVENIVGRGEIARYEQILLSHNVFKSCLLLMRQNEYLWGKALTTLRDKAFENVIGLPREKADNQHFTFTPDVFCTIKDANHHFN